MQKISIPYGGLTILSGAPASGKSSAVKGLPSGVVVSSDFYRKIFFGESRAPVDSVNEEIVCAMVPYATDDNFVFDIMSQVVNARLSKGLTTVVDSTNTTEGKRNWWVEIANKYDVPVLLVIFDISLEQLHLNNRSEWRTSPVPDKVVDKFHSQLEKTSKVCPNYTVVNAPVVLELDFPYVLPNGENIVVVGDIHGCYDTFLDMYESFIKFKATALFLGDYVDRGFKSIECLDMVMQLHSEGHYVILGNHEYNVLRILLGQEVNSDSSKITAHQILLKGKAYTDKVIKFFKSLPDHYVRIETTSFGTDVSIFCHADIEHFDLFNQPPLERVRGESKYHSMTDTDGRFYAWVEGMARAQIKSGVPQADSTSFHLYRGHILPTSPNADQVTVLEKGIGFGGYMCMNDLRTGETHEQKDDFDYSVSKPYTFKSRLAELPKKLVSSVRDSTGHLTLHKYTQKAFAKSGNFMEFPVLKEARGIVLGLDGNPCNTVFDRVFNYMEIKEHNQYDVEQEYWAVEKINGFLVNICLHPYCDELLVTCSGSFEGEHVDMAKKWLYKEGRYKAVKDWLQDKPYASTLHFECVDLLDPHIVSYTEKQQGLYLIGYNGKCLLGLGTMFLAGLFSSWYSPATLLRPDTILWGTYTVSNFEGWMVCANDGTPLFKLKTIWYLASKYFGRMSDSKVALMFSNTEKFISQLDSDMSRYRDVIKHIAITTNESAWLNLSEQERIKEVSIYLEQYYDSGDSD